MLKTVKFCLVVCTAISTVFSSRTGNFKLSDDGVNGEGSYTINNQTAEINLHLLIGNLLKNIGGQQGSVPILKPSWTEAANTNKQAEISPTNSQIHNEQLSKEYQRYEPTSSQGQQQGNNDRQEQQQANKGSERQQQGNKESERQQQGNNDRQEQQQANKESEGQQQGNNDRQEQQQASKESEGQQQVNKESDKILQPEDEMLSDDDLNFAMDGLTEHNRFRRIHDSVDLKLDRKMCLQAQKFAQQLSKLGTLKHSARDSRPGQGENLAMGCSSGDSSMTASAASKKWYDEVCNYNFDENAFQKQCGHFSQIVWKSTDKLGIGKAYGTKWGMNCTFIVARYSPQGNIANSIKHNVWKGAFEQSYCNTVTRSLDGSVSSPRRPQEDQAEYFRDQYGLNEGFLNDEGEGMKSIGFRGKIPRVNPMRIQVL